MEKRKVVPFYMTYPVLAQDTNENSFIKDFNYLQQLYPVPVRNYQKQVVDAINKMDYYGSRIYDLFPDRQMIYKLSNDIIKMIQAEEKTTPLDYQPQKIEVLEYLIPVLVLNELYRRRHSRQRESAVFN